MEVRRAAEGRESLVVTAVPAGLMAQAFSTGRHSRSQELGRASSRKPSMLQVDTGDWKGLDGASSPQRQRIPARLRWDRTQRAKPSSLAPSSSLSGKPLSEKPTSPEDPQTCSAGTHWAATPALTPRDSSWIWRLRHCLEQRTAETHQGGGLGTPRASGRMGTSPRPSGCRWLVVWPPNPGPRGSPASFPLSAFPGRVSTALPGGLAEGAGVLGVWHPQPAQCLPWPALPLTRGSTWPPEEDPGAAAEAQQGREESHN